MRIVILSSEFPPGPGGIGTHAYQVAKNLMSRGHDIKVLTKQDYEPLDVVQKFNRKQKFSVTSFPRKKTVIPNVFSRYCLLRKTMAEVKPEIVLASGDAMVYLSGLSIPSDIPWIAVEHGRTPRASWEKALKRWSLKRASGVVCVSEYTKKRMVDMGVCAKKVRVIYNGINPEDIHEPSVEEIEEFMIRYGLKGTRIITTVGNVSERKGQDIVIRALPEILKSVPEVHYVIAGLPTKKNEYLDIAKQLGVSSHVHFLGKIDAKDLSCLLTACELFVMASRHAASGDFEGFGIAALEAACYAKPAVVSRESGLVEAIEDGVTGLSVPAEDSSAAAKSIVRLLLDKNQCSDMGMAARSRAVNKQTWTQRAEEYEGFLKELCGRSNS